MAEPINHTVDATAAFTAVAALLDYAPRLAGLAALIWYLWRFYEHWVKPRIKAWRAR